MMLTMSRALKISNPKRGIKGASLQTLAFSLSLYRPLAKMRRLENTWIIHSSLREMFCQETTRRPCESIVSRMMTNKNLRNSLLTNKKKEFQLTIVQIKETFMHPFKILWQISWWSRKMSTIKVRLVSLWFQLFLWFYLLNKQSWGQWKWDCACELQYE